MSDKYPRTPHLPWSPGGTNDDKRLASASHFLNKRVVLTEKLDGSNVCLTRDNVFARSHSGAPSHPSFDFLKSMHAQLRFRIDCGQSVFGEYCYAVHSITYDHLPAYLFVFGVRDDKTGAWSSWTDVCDVARKLKLYTVPLVLCANYKTEDGLKDDIESEMTQPSVFGGNREGIVVRTASHFSVFKNCVAKYVRADHVQTDKHWTAQKIVKQKLYGEKE